MLRLMQDVEYYYGVQLDEATPDRPACSGSAVLNASGGSILLPLLLHWQLNNPIFPVMRIRCDGEMFAAWPGRRGGLSLRRRNALLQPD